MDTARTRATALIITLYLGILLGVLWHPQCCMGEQEQILLLSIPRGPDFTGTTQASTAPAPSRNLVLYLYTPPGGHTVIERAAITEGTHNELGDELQELEDLRGARFNRASFLNSNRWIRDLNFDGHPDLVLLCNRAEDAACLPFLYIFSPLTNDFQRDVEEAYALEPQIRHIY